MKAVQQVQREPDAAIMIASHQGSSLNPHTPRSFCRLLLALLVCLFANLTASAASPDPSRFAELFQWDELARFPDPLGVAGPYAGISSNALIVAGGANFPGGLWKDGEKNPDAKKIWWAKTYVLESPDSGQAWLETAPLARPLAYGGSVTHPEYGLICIGGGDAEKHYNHVFALQWDRQAKKINRTDLPALPEPVSFTSAVLLGDVIYVAGGQSEPDGEAMKNFWALDLAKGHTNSQWRALPTWDGPARVLCVMAALNDSVYVISGRDVQKSPDGELALTFLTDTHRYDPGKGTDPGSWIQLADAPRSVCAAPTPAVALGSTSHIAIFGGADGTIGGRPPEDHPGFTRDILAYHAITDTWVNLGEVPQETVAGTTKGSHVTVPVVQWGDRIIIPSGEASPGVRTTYVWSATVTQAEGSFGAPDYILLVLYLGALVGMGVYFSKREKSTNDYFLGGQRVPWWAAGLSIYGTELSAITFLAIPAKVFATNWVYFVTMFAIVASAPFVVKLFLPFYRRLGVTTAYEYLEKRFNVTTRLLASATFILMQLGRMGIVLFLPALALSTVTGFNIYYCILAMGVLSTIYTVLGGIEAVIWTDVLQVFVLLGGALLSLVLIVMGTDGGLGGMISMSHAAGKFKLANLTWDIATASLWVLVLGGLITNIFGYSTNQAVVQRYLTTKDEKQAARAVWTNALMIVPGALVFFLLGTGLWAFYKANPELLNPGGRADDVFAWFIASQLPTGIAGLVIAGVFAASMSSLDSAMNSMATAITTDWYRKIKPKADDHSCLRLARWLTVLLGVVGTGSGLYMATFQDTSMWDNYLRLMGLLGAGLGGLFVAAVLTRKIHGTGAVAGFIVSAVVIFFVQSSGAVSFFLYAAIGSLTCVIVAYIVSLVVPQKPNVDGLTIYTLPER